MLQSHLHELRKAERRAHEAIQSAVRKIQSYSLLEAVRDRLPDYTGPRQMDAAHAVYDVDRACRELYGPANGVWVPFQVLARDLAASNTPAVIGGGVQPSLAQALVPFSAVVGSGANVISVQQAGAVRLPKIAQPANAANAWIGEGSNFAVREPTFDAVLIEPKTLAVTLTVSRRLLRDASVDIERELRRHLLQSIMNEVDRAVIAGSGGVEPLGLLANSDIAVVAAGANGGPLNWDHVTQLEFEVASRNGRIENGAFITNAATLRKLRRTQRGTGLDYVMADSTRLLGYPLRVSEHVPSNLTKGTGSNLSALIFGDFSSVVITFWGPSALDIAVDPMTKAKNAQVVIVARADVGVGVIHPEAFAKMVDVQTS
jgi:HK97 family phage major capsid protein